MQALAGGDPLAGLRILDALEERGRDLRGFLNQVVEAVRASLVRALTTPGVAPGATASLAAAARRLADIDPARGAGGLRFQLELALLAPLVASRSPQASRRLPRRRAGRGVHDRRAAPRRRRGAARSGRGCRATRPPHAGRRREPPPPPPRPRRAAERARGRHARARAAPSPAAPPAPRRPRPASIAAAWPTIVDRLSQSPPIKPLITSAGRSRSTATWSRSASPRARASRTRSNDVGADRAGDLGACSAARSRVRCVATNLDLNAPADPETDR